MLNSIRTFKDRNEAAPLSGRVDFCVTIPKNRFMEVQERDHDAYEFEGYHVNIKWTGIELAILLRKRLQVYTGESTQKTDKAMQRLMSILHKRFDNIPTNIPIKIGNRTVELDIFHYVLRHTFWRPRDVLYQWGRIISTAEIYAKKGINFSVDTVKLLVAQNNAPIIKFEFLSEFKDHILNLDLIIGKFRGKKQVLDYESFRDCTKGILIETPYTPKKSNMGADRILLEKLADIGFMGFYVPNSNKLRNSCQNNSVFVFNETEDMTNIISEFEAGNILAIIHPIFIEYLGLLPSEDFVTCEYSDDYLEKQEARVMALSN